MDNLIKKYQFDMERHEKKLEKMKQVEKTSQGNYDLDDIKVSDDEREQDFIERTAEERIRKMKSYDDEPYKAKDDESENLEKQYENIA